MVHGLPEAVKTVIASRAAAILRNEGIEVRILQLDEIRKVLTRTRNILMMSEVSFMHPLLIWQNS